jgi:cation diffusion facilitator family transporter
MTKKGDYYFVKVQGWLSLILNVIIFAIKYWAGTVSGSVALIADAWHTLSDSMTSAIIIVGAKIAEKPPDEDHPFGHGRAESIASIIIGIILFAVGFRFFHDGVFRLREGSEASFGSLAIWVTIVSIVLKEALASFSIIKGKKLGMRSMIADGWHHRTDAISSVVLLAGILIGSYVWWIDGAMAMVIGVMIVWTAYKILKDTISPLLGSSPDPIVKDRLEELGREVYDKDMTIHHLHLHDYGTHKEITFHIWLPGEMNLSEAHEITHTFIRIIEQKMEMKATIYVDAKE